MHGYITPPSEVGLLPGTLRAELLASGQAIEGRLGLEDMERAKSCYLGNSVRGLVRAERLQTELILEEELGDD